MKNESLLWWMNKTSEVLSFWCPNKTYMVDCIPLTESPNAQKKVQAIDDTLKEMKISRANCCLLLSDAVPYMIAVARALKVLYPQMLHVMCLVHLIHNAEMKVKMHFDKVDEQIACVKAATVKNKSRRALFDGIGMPPEPVVTRWGSWLQAAFYYGKHLPVIREIVRAVLKKQSSMKGMQHH